MTKFPSSKKIFVGSPKQYNTFYENENCGDYWRNREWKIQSHGIFAAKGYPCYSADAAGRRLLSEDQKVISAVIAAFGPAVVSPTMPLDRKKLAELVFKDKAQLQRLNAIIHPAVAEDFKAFLAQHKDAALVFKEAAILIESGSYTQCDGVFGISPKATRLPCTTTGCSV